MTNEDHHSHSIYTAGCKTTPPSQIKGDEFDKIFHLKKQIIQKNLFPLLASLKELTNQTLT